MTKGAYEFFSSCISWPDDPYKEGGLCDMQQNARSITRKTFLQHVSYDILKTLEKDLGYDSQLKMCNDWHVGYYRGMLYGKRVYFFKHSAIEYVFKET